MSRVGFQEVVCFAAAHPDPVALEINSLENLLKEKENELRKAQSEIRALQAAIVLKDKAVEELACEVNRQDEKLRSNENRLEQRNLEIKKLNDEKKEALAAQFAAEATLRRVYADQKYDDSLPLELVIAPLEAEIKMHKNEVVALQEDKRALERLIKSKEVVLLEAERILRSALERTLIVEEVQNQNYELQRQIEICHEENKILEKTNRQKISEVEKLGQTIKELEEVILSEGAAANTISDYRRQISELNEEKRTLERELARVKISANRIAAVMANEWRGESNRVMPVKQWLEERRIMQAEMQKLKEKLSISERAYRTEGQIKEKLKLRLKTLEEGLRNVPTSSITNISLKNEKSNFFGILLSNSSARNRTTSGPKASAITKHSILMVNRRKIPCVDIGMMPLNGLEKKSYCGESFLKKSLWSPQRKASHNNEKENEKMDNNFVVRKTNEIRNLENDNNYEDTEGFDITNNDSEDMVSGFLYDRLQKEVINLRKLCESKDFSLSSKDEEIKMLVKKVKTLNKAVGVESKKTRREVATQVMYSSSMEMDERIGRTKPYQRSVRCLA